MLAGLGVVHRDHADLRQLSLARVGKTDGEDLVAPREEREAALPAGRGEEVRDDEHQRAPTDLTQCRLEQLGQRGRWRALESRTALEQIDEAQHLHASAARRDDAFDALAVDDRADLVAVARQQPTAPTAEADQPVTL